ncbi:MAG: hypothetical protein JETT_1646 [Candidatus Jettenia ecosi]|uniref:Uncharacterized protein n=1 Tax=Candidatus Jettenia ecosi TaxID=2494326 RepID=A0A533QBI6_9BACT|nr:MAG: hypothetical protein JETT_1646 [Candidatus Jettenia ecosi]
MAEFYEKTGRKNEAKAINRKSKKDLFKLSEIKVSVEDEKSFLSSVPSVKSVVSCFY